MSRRQTFQLNEPQTSKIMANTKTVPFKRFSTKHKKNQQKAESAKSEESNLKNHSRFSQKPMMSSNKNPMTHSNQNPTTNFNQKSVTNFNQESMTNFNKKPMTNLEHFPQNHNTTLVVVPIEQLADMMQGILRAELANHKSTQQIPSEEELMTATETIAFLRVSRPTYQKLRRDGEIKAVSISERRILYRKSDLLDYINSKVN